MRTTTKERQRMREERRWPTAPEDVRALLDDLDEALSELAALRAVAEAARSLLGRMADGTRPSTERLRDALRAWEERER